MKSTLIPPVLRACERSGLEREHFHFQLFNIAPISCPIWPPSWFRRGWGWSGVITGNHPPTPSLTKEGELFYSGELEGTGELVGTLLISQLRAELINYSTTSPLFLTKEGELFYLGSWRSRC
jgi:hypothetical protein